VRELQTEGGLASTCCLYLSAPDGAARHREFACNEAFSALLATDLQLWLGQKTGFAGRFHLCGLSLSGLAAAFAVLGHPNAFAGAICQSPSAWWNDEWLTNWLPMDGGRRGRFWLSVGEGETTSGISHPPSGMYQGTSQLASVGRLAEALGKLGADLHYQTYVGGHDPVCWARELPQALSWLLHGA
jgi:enterochelin esterase family protein